MATDPTLERLAMSLANRGRPSGDKRHWRTLTPQRRRWWLGWALGIVSGVERAGLRIVKGDRR